MVNGSTLSRRGPWFLACGAIAPPLHTIVFTVLGAVTPGYSPIRDFDSNLSYGPYGWIMILNFIVYGILMVAFATGIRSALRTGTASVAGPILFAVIGVLLIGAGVFVPDPGHPVTWHGRLHIQSASFAEICAIAACFVLARRFARDGARRFALYCRATGIAIPLVGLGPVVVRIVGINGLEQQIQLALIYTWTVLLALQLLKYRRTSP
jgi:hypothetical membrane protein